MTDPRLQRMASVIVNYCLELKCGKELRIEGQYIAEPLIREIYREALLAGAYPSIMIGIPGLGPIRYRYSTDDQLKHVSEIDWFVIENLDAVVTLWADWNTKELTGADSKKMAMLRAARKELNTRWLERIAKRELRWCGTLFPTHASAQDAEMGLEDYEDFVFGAMLLNRPDPIAEWRRVSQEQQRMVDYLNQVEAIEMKTKDTDLRFNCDGRKWINCDGKENFPDGEVFTGPIEDSVEGTIRFSFPAVYGGKEVEDVRLRFEKGKCVEARAAKGEEYLNAMLDSDEGARYVGEISFGTNYGIQRFTKNTLFDEKIGGTMHLAVGASLSESGGINKSSLHWDMVCDFRPAGEVRADGKLILKDGKLLI
jgi:aminopeptidase